MLEEILSVVSETESINDTIIVSKDESAFTIGKKFNCIEIFDEKECGVNDAVFLGNEFLAEHDYSCSIVLPQDIPLILSDDLNNLLKWYYHKKNDGYFYALRNILSRLVRSFLKFVFFTIFFNNKKRVKYLYRLLGLYNSILGKESSFRIKN